MGMVSQFAQHGAAVPHFVGNVSCDDELRGSMLSVFAGSPAANSPAVRHRCRCALPLVAGQVFRWALGGDALLPALMGFLLVVARHCVASWSLWDVVTV